MENTIIREMLEALEKKELKAHEQMQAVTKELADIAEAKARLLKEGKGINAVIAPKEKYSDPESNESEGGISSAMDRLKRRA